MLTTTGHLETFDTLENPVRAGLVTCAEEYPFAGSLVYPIAEILAAVQMMPASRKSG